jgi:hypothetical protein
MSGLFEFCWRPWFFGGSPSLPFLLQVEEGEGGGGFSGVPGVPAESEGGFRMFIAGRMVLRLILESHLVAVSAPLVMPLRRQACYHGWKWRPGAG